MIAKRSGSDAPRATPQADYRSFDGYPDYVEPLEAKCVEVAPEYWSPSADECCIHVCERAHKVDIGDPDHTHGAPDEASAVEDDILSGLRVASNSLCGSWDSDPTLQQAKTITDGMERGLKPTCTPCAVYALDAILASIGDGNPSRPQLCDILRKICQKTDLLPSSCIISLDLPHIEFSRIFGQGGFGTIRRGKFEGGDVALKELRCFPRRIKGSPSRKYIFKELFILRYIRHRNIVAFRGVYNRSSTLYIVYNWMSQGNVNEYLKHHEAANKVLLLRDVAAGMKYLHESGVVHGDLKGANVLVDDEGVARIADFGLAAFKYEGKAETDTALIGSTRWMAPELFDPDKFAAKRVRTTHSDVYAFAMTAVEMISSDMPFRDIQSNWTVILHVSKGTRPRRPDVDPTLCFPNKIWELVTCCWDQYFMQRPSFSVIVDCLKSELGA